jgi:uncharacterized phosphosugar-binding protein
MPASQVDDSVDGQWTLSIEGTDTSLTIVTDIISRCGGTLRIPAVLMSHTMQHACTHMRIPCSVL